MTEVSNIGRYPKSVAQRKKISDTLKRLYAEGKKVTWNKGKKTGIVPKTAFKRGEPGFWKGKHLYEATKKILRENHLGKGLHKGIAYGGFDTQFKKGEEHPFYNSNKQRDYGLTRRGLKEKHEEIKKDARYKCQYENCDRCSNVQLKSEELNVHHKNGDKKDYSKENIIVFCISRHISEQWKLNKSKKSQEIQKYINK